VILLQEHFMVLILMKLMEYLSALCVTCSQEGGLKKQILVKRRFDDKIWLMAPRFHSSMLNMALMQNPLHLKIHISETVVPSPFIFGTRNANITTKYHQKHLREEVFCYTRKIHLKTQNC
jgi:hypothetical protein